MSSWHTSQLTYALGLGGMLSFYGIVTIIVYMLPASSVGYTEKIVIIGLVLITLPFVLLFSFFRSRRRKKLEAAEAAAQPAAEASEAVAPSAPAAKAVGSYPETEAGLQEVVQFLRSSKLGSDGKESIYSLPWHLVAGPPRSGKSSLIAGAELDVKTLPSQRESEQSLIKPTRSVDWRVTSEGVFIDTAGRFCTDADSDEWAALLESIKKIRPGRPIDGLILVVSASDVIKRDERDMEGVAKNMRARVDDAGKRFSTRFPTYLVFSNADSIEGFEDSFSLSKNEDSDLVWGTTIALENADSGQSAFEPEYEILKDAAMKRRIARLSAPFPPLKQLRIFNFPLHFGSARRRFGAFVNSLFRPDPFSSNPLVRGFYFQATQPARTGSGMPSKVGRAYFTRRLLRDVILRDRDLAAVFEARGQSGPILGWLLTGIMTLVVLALLAGAGVSLYNNGVLMREAQARGEKLVALTRTDAYKNPAKTTEEQLRTEINTTENLRELLEKLDEYERGGAPWRLGFGLYTGNRVYRQTLLPVYMAVIENRYKSAALRRMEGDLRKFAAAPGVANPAKLSDQEEQTLSKNYDLLKAYMMLTGEYKQRAEASHIAAVMKDYWIADLKVPSELRTAALAQLDFWAKQVDRDDNDYRFPRIEADAKLIRDAQAKLQAFPAVYRYYKRKVSEISKTVEEKIGPFSVAAILQRGGADTSFIEGTYQVPAAFTRSGRKLMETAIAEANEKLSEDDWVLGELGKAKVAQTTDAKLMEDRYYRDYVDSWRAFVKGANVRPYKNKDDATAALQAFSSNNSPMKILVAEVSRNTNLSAPSDNPTWWEWIKSWFVREDDGTGGSTPPEKEFKPLFAFIGKKADKERAPVENYGTAIKGVFEKLNGISADKMKQVAEELAAESDTTLQLKTREGAIASMLGSFNETAAGQDVASLLQQPLGNLRNLLGAGAQEQLKKAWTDQILPAAREIERGYPFDDSQSDADLTKLTAFLNPVDGKLSKFYDDKLKRYFDEVGGELKLKDSAEVKFSDDFVRYLNNAFALRKALFGTGQTPKFEYTFSFKPGKDAIVEVVIDGQKLTSEGTGSIKGSFPAAASVENGVVLSSSSAGPAPPADANSGSQQSGPSQLKFPGTWGLFRFVDAGRPQKQPGGEYSLGFSVGGRSVSAQILPSGGDLFNKSIFRQVKAPDAMVK